MPAEDRILRLLEDVGDEGILQSDISRLLNLSKSTVSEILSNFESEGRVVRKSVSARSYRVWKVEHLPFPYHGVLRLGILKSTEYSYLITAALRNEIAVKIFDDPIDLTVSLSRGRIDMAASPLLTQMIMGALMKNFKIVRIVAKNGSGVVFSKSRNGIFGTTEISTMDRNLRKFLSLQGASFKIRYFNSPEAMVKSLRSGEIEGLAIWEPYLTMLKEENFKTIYFSEVLEDFICCSLAINIESLSLNEEKVGSFLSFYDRICKRSLKGKELDEIAKTLGFDEKLVEKSINNYLFCPKLIVEEIETYMEESGIDLSRESLVNVLDSSQVV